MHHLIIWLKQSTFAGKPGQNNIHTANKNGDEVEPGKSENERILGTTIFGASPERIDALDDASKKVYAG